MDKIAIENAIKCLQGGLEKIADATDYNAETNTFGKPDPTLCGIAQDLHDAWSQLATAIDLDLSQRPDLSLNRRVELAQTA